MANDIHPSAQIARGVELGDYNRIGANVVIGGFKAAPCRIRLGDCNVIHENTRILCNDLAVGDYNVFHNSMLIHGEQPMRIGHNGWFGQNTILDSTGGLTIGNGVRVGMYSQIWTHAASGELIEGCTLFVMRPTVIEDEVWLVGSCIVGSGLTLGRRSICLIGSNVTKDTEAGKVYAGVPAKPKEGLNYYKPMTVADKLALMRTWADEFAREARAEITHTPSAMIVRRERDKVIVAAGELPDDDSSQTSWFSLASKTYTKKLSSLEREFIFYLYGHKARFVPA